MQHNKHQTQPYPTTDGSTGPLLWWSLVWPAAAQTLSAHLTLRIKHLPDYEYGVEWLRIT